MREMQDQEDWELGIELACVLIALPFMVYCIRPAQSMGTMTLFLCQAAMQSLISD